MDKIFFKKLFSNLSTETFEVEFWDGSIEKFGDGEITFRIKFNKPIEKNAILEDASLAFGEAYMNEDIEFQGNLQKIIESVYKNKKSFLNEHKLLNKLLKLKGTSIKKQKQDISHHYDLGNDFYKIWLDESMTYSCAYFENCSDSLAQAQSNKVDHILRKLNLSEGQKLLDIGCGWGTLIIRAAKEYKVHSVGITLSQEQFNEVTKRIAAEHLEGQVEVKLMDYREMTKEKIIFDRIVSVGMLEHVGQANLPVYMETVDKLLTYNGVALVHCITGLHETEGNQWIGKYIFPGGHIPSVNSIIETFPQHDFHIVDIESLRLHYNRTLEHWVANFEANLDKVRALGFDEKFIRMWRLYLNACAASFHYGVVDVHQILFTKGLNNDIPMTRDYMLVECK